MTQVFREGSCEGPFAALRAGRELGEPGPEPRDEELVSSPDLHDDPRCGLTIAGPDRRLEKDQPFGGFARRESLEAHVLHQTDHLVTLAELACQLGPLEVPGPGMW